MTDEEMLDLVGSIINRGRIVQFISGVDVVVPQGVHQGIMTLLEDIAEDAQDIALHYCANTEGDSGIPCASP